MSRLINFIKGKMKAVPKASLLTAVIIVVASFLFAPNVHAGVSEWAGEVIGGLIGAIIWALGQILILVVKCLILVASYQDFINVQGVIEGWRIVRDLANMFFVVVLLIIAFSTILHYENYNYKKLLPKLVLMAILVNFSKTICGLLIDVAQIVMLTFVNAFKDIAGGNFISMLGIRDVITFAEDSETAGFWEIIGAYVLGLIYMIISLVVITTMLMILVMRLVMIWIYVVLSPLAYLLSAFPGGSKYSTDWWTDFTKNLIVGPVLAFFIWLSLMMLQTGNDVNYGTADDEVANDIGQISDEPVSVTEASRPSALIKFVLAIGMLIGGLKIAQGIGGAAGSIAGKGMGRLNKLGAMGMGAAGGFALGRAKWGGRLALRGASGAMTGIGGVSVWKDKKFGKSMTAMGNIGKSYYGDLVDDVRKKKTEKKKKLLEKIGVGAETADKYVKTFEKDRGHQGVVNTLGATGTAALAGSAFGPIGAVVGAVVGASFAQGARLAANRKDKKVESAQKEFDASQTAYNTAVSAAGGVLTDPAVISAKADMDQKKSNLNAYKGNFDETTGKRNKFKAAIYGLVDDISTVGTKYSVKGAKKIAKTETDAKDMIKNIGNDPSGNSVHGFSNNAFYGTDGQKADHEARVRHLAADNSDAQKARNVMLTELRSGSFDPKNKHNQDVVMNMAKGLAASKKKGGLDMSLLAPLMNEIDSMLAKMATAGGVAPGLTIDSFKDSVISYRDTGKVGEQGTGGMYVDSFAKGKEGKDVMGVDFEKMNLAGFDIDPTVEGINIPPDLMQQAATVLVSQIDEEMAALKASHDAGDINDKTFQKEMSTFEAAKARLQDPSQLKSLSLINTKSKNFGRDERLASAYHEQIHAAGIDNEDVTEGLTQLLMKNQLYGRNAVTGGRHAQEIAALAKAMTESGKSTEEILVAMGKEIQNRAKYEGSRSERALKKEAGGETERQFVQGAHGGASEAEVKLDTGALEKSLSDLEKSFRKAKPGTSMGKMDTLFRNLGFLIRRSDMKTVKALNKLRPDKATTPLEIEIIDGAVKSE